MNKANALHEKALRFVSRYYQSESDLLEVLQEIDESKSYQEFSCTSLFSYATQKLGLSESVALNFIGVARKAKEVPALQAMIRNQTLSVSKARKILPVLTQENHHQWLSMAVKLPQKILEREVARVAPKTATPERTTYVTESRLKLELGLSEELLEKLKRAQDLVSQSKQKHATLEDTLERLLEAYLERHDPVEKAKRIQERSARKIQSNAQSPSVKHDFKKKDDESNEVTRQENESKREEKEEDVARHVIFSESRNNLKISSDKPLAEKVNSKNSSNLRKPHPASLTHEINLRDQDQCTDINSEGIRCSQKRWLEVHHIIPKEHGGKDTLENLTTLYRGHHQLLHKKAAS